MSLVLGSAWTGAEMEGKLSVSARKEHVDVLLSVIEDINSKEYMQELSDL